MIKNTRFSKINKNIYRLFVVLENDNTFSIDVSMPNEPNDDLIKEVYKKNSKHFMLEVTTI